MTFPPDYELQSDLEYLLHVRNQWDGLPLEVRHYHIKKETKYFNFVALVAQQLKHMERYNERTT